MSGRPSGRVVNPGPGNLCWHRQGHPGGADWYALWRLSVSARRVGPRALARLSDGLTQRDRDILESVRRFRLLDARQIEQLHFTGHATPLAAARAARRVLARLARHRLLIRLDRRVGGVRAGSAGHVYALGPIGHRLLSGDSRRRWREPSTGFVDHTLAIAQLVVDARIAETAGTLELVDYQTEPDCWRSFQPGLGGVETLKPDLYMVTATSQTELVWFIEIDLGTESGGAIGRKCRTYHDYWTTGTEQHQIGVFPKVLWTTPSERRREFLQRTIAGLRTVERDLFAVTTTNKAVEVLAGGETVDFSGGRP